MANSLLHTPHQQDGLVAAPFLPKEIQQHPPPPVQVPLPVGEEHKCEELNVQVIDDTALIDHGKLIKLEKKPKRRVRKTRKKKDPSSDKTTAPERTSTYSRKEMEVLRFERLEDQKRKWIEVYCRLDPLVAREYDALIDHNSCVPRFNFDPRPPLQKSANLFVVAAMVKANPRIITAH